MNVRMRLKLTFISTVFLWSLPTLSQSDLTNDPQYNPYPSHRNVVYGNKGMVATSNPLAAQAGLEVLKKGGNAVDAAIATAAALTVLEPTGNGIGSDNFAILWINGKMYGINGSGKSPKALTLDHFKGKKSIPRLGWDATTVPAAPKTWAVLSKRFGKLSLSETLAPAVAYARDGFTVQPNVAYLWNSGAAKFTSQKGKEFKEWAKVFTDKGRLPKTGELWKMPDHAKTLELIGKSNAEAFYSGEIAKKIVKAAKETGGMITIEDLKAVEPEWVEPISVNYHGYDVWEIPPNGQGITALMALNILDGYKFDHRGPETAHVQIEAMKLAFADSLKYVADQRFAKVPVAQMISKEYGENRRKLITKEAQIPASSDFEKHGTVYLCTADSEGNMVSFIQSNYQGFGSGIVIPGTGIALNNRGSGFSLDPNHPNVAAPEKRPYNTIIPGFITKNGKAVGPFGVMGGYMQPQGHVQVLMNLIDFKMNPQQALDAPRWQWNKGKEVKVEPSFPSEDVRALRSLGHQIEYNSTKATFGRGEIIIRTDDGILAGATESRADGCVATW